MAKRSIKRRLRTDRNKYLVRPSEGVVELIILENDKRTIKASTFFDIDDLERVQEYSWHLMAAGYIATGGSWRSGFRCYLHRFLMDAPEDLTVDHIDGDGLNNRKENLRLVTKAQNGQNRTRISRNKKSELPLGVNHSENRYRMPYVVRLMVCGKSYSKHFDTVEEASQWYWETKQRLLDEHKDGITLGGAQ